MIIKPKKPLAVVESSEDEEGEEAYDFDQRTGEDEEEFNENLERDSDAEEYDEIELGEEDDGTVIDYIEPEIKRVEAEVQATKKKAGRPRKVKADENLPAVKEEGEIVAADGAMEISTKLVFKKAMSNFFDQAIKMDSKNLADVELGNAKSTSFVEALGTLPAISHELEIIGAEEYKFKRKDELEILNALKAQCLTQVQAEDQTIALIQAKLADLVENVEEATPESISMLQNALELSRGSTSRMVKTFEQLIQLERKSGSRPWGQNKATTRNINYFTGLEGLRNGNLGGGGDPAKPKGDIKKPREMTPEELESLGGGD